MRHSIETQELLDTWLRVNALTSGEVCILMIKMALVRKMHVWLVASQTPLESTKMTLDYLKSHDSYQYWATECADTETKMQRFHIDQLMSTSATEVLDRKLLTFSNQAGIIVDSNLEEFITETGFGTPHELGVALDRLIALEAIK